MSKQYKPGILIGAAVGLALTAPLVAVFYLASQLIKTPFVPFDVFDWMGRVLPGQLVTFGIDTIVSVVTALKMGELSGSAKIAERALAIGGLVMTGMVVGAVLFAVRRQREVKPRYLPGLIVGIAVGLPVVLISLIANQRAEAGPLVSTVWTLASFIVWGLALNWVYNRLSEFVAPASDGQPAPLSGNTTPVLAANGVEVIDRRRFIVTVGGATAALTVVGAGLGALLGRGSVRAEVLDVPAWSASNKLPNADDALTPAPGTRAEFTPVKDHYQIDINTLPPVVKEEEWKLEISGLVKRPLQLTLKELRGNYEPMSQFVTLACISNPIAGELIGTQRWTGVSLKTVLADAGLDPKATHLRMTAADGFDEVVALDVVQNDNRVMLTYAWDDQPLTTSHGFPLRIYIPNRYGMKQPKWLMQIEAIDQWEEGYWVRRGWDKEALMRATAVIDTIAADQPITAGGDQLIPIGGIAHAGARGIGKVQVQVDGGAWVEAKLRQPISDTTWVLWRYDWPFQAGDHTFAVRCVENDGTPQIETVADVRPSGATGIHNRNKRL